MRLRITNTQHAELFVNIIKHISGYCESVNIHINSDGLYVQALDASCVCIFEIKLNCTWFDEFECTQNIILGVNISLFSQILNIYKKNQYVVLEYDEESENSDYCCVSFQNNDDTKKTSGCVPSKFNMPLMDLETELLTIPDTDYQMKSLINFKQLAQYLKHLKNICDTIEIKCDEYEFLIKSSGSDIKSETNLTDESCDIYDEYEIAENCEITTSITIKHVCYFMTLSSIFDGITNNINFNISEDQPVYFNVNLENENYVRLYIAPKVQD
jgi:proliferating cell nuclear antigen PCNA